MWQEGLGGVFRYEGDLLRQQESVLYRLGKLKEKLSQLSSDGNSGTPLVEGQKITLTERHQGILGIIGALRDEMKFLAHLQKQMEVDLPIFLWMICICCCIIVLDSLAPLLTSI